MTLAITNLFMIINTDQLFYTALATWIQCEDMHNIYGWIHIPRTKLVFQDEDTFVKLQKTVFESDSLEIGPFFGQLRFSYLLSLPPADESYLPLLSIEIKQLKFLWY